MQGSGNRRFEAAGRHVLLLAALLTLTGGLGACAGMHESKDYERHRYSQIVTPFDRTDVVYVDMKFDPKYPDDDPVAEQTRMDWIAAWLELRQMCDDGFEVEKRRPFDMMENNPARYDIRYEIKCKSADGG